MLFVHHVLRPSRCQTFVDESVSPATTGAHHPQTSADLTIVVTAPSTWLRQIVYNNNGGGGGGYKMRGGVYNRGGGVHI